MQELNESNRPTSAYRDPELFARQWIASPKGQKARNGLLKLRRELRQAVIAAMEREGLLPVRQLASIPKAKACPACGFESSSLEVEIQSSPSSETLFADRP